MGLQVVVDFEVVDESEDWLVVNKPAPLIVHPANLKPEPTLLGGVEQLLAFEIANGRSPAVVNRLDRDTSGLVLVAKHKQAARELGILFENRRVEKEYLAVVMGWPVADEWVFEGPMLRAHDVMESNIWVRQMVHPAGKASRTQFCVESRFERKDGRFSVVRCLPETGRMHQLRVHLAECGHPIVGDKIYSGDGCEYLEWLEDGWTDRLKQRLWMPRHALHASRLCLEWHGRFYDWRAEMTVDLREFVAGMDVSETPGVVIWSRLD